MITIPFEVVRRQGSFFARADGLADLFPSRFKRTKTGDYLMPKDLRYGSGTFRQQESAIAFERFFRSQFGVHTKLHRQSETGERHSIIYWTLTVRS
jgi:hypothetical protein